MRVCGLDLETTGLDKEEHYITELGYVVKDVGDPKPLVAEQQLCSLPEGVRVSEEITEITKIKDDHLEAVGIPLSVAMQRLDTILSETKTDYIVAHNGAGFDHPFLAHHAPNSVAVGLPWLDTKKDIKYPAHYRATNLIYVAANLGFLNPFPHAALFDAMTTLKVFESFDPEKIVARSKLKDVVVRACIQPPFKDPAPAGEKEADKAKALGFRWQDPGIGKTYEKCWVKVVKEDEVADILATESIKVVQVEVLDGG